MNMKNFAKGFGLCMIGFIGGVVVTGYGIGKIVTRSDHIQDGISKELSDWLDDILFEEKQTKRRPTHGSYDSNDVIFSDQNSAENVLNGMQELIEKYGVATIADFKELSGLSEEITHDDHICGWSDCNGVIVVALRGGGYRINFRHLPKEF